jgi:cytokinin dehydrogenase
VFDLTSLDTIGPIVDGRITVDAGCRWNAVLPRTLAQGLMPPVLPDYIGQTVGGTLSVGGIGAMSFREGAQIDHVVELRAVTGNGRIVDCSPHRNRELFEMLRSGPGRRDHVGCVATRPRPDDRAAVRPHLPRSRRAAR